jgi:hypothetical protein
MVMRFDQRWVHLTLHAGSTERGATGWRPIRVAWITM